MTKAVPQDYSRFDCKNEKSSMRRPDEVQAWRAWPVGPGRERGPGVRHPARRAPFAILSTFGRRQKLLLLQRRDAVSERVRVVLQIHPGQHEGVSKVPAAASSSVGASASRLLGLRRPRRPLLAAALISVCVCWMLLMPPLRTPQRLAAASLVASASAAAATATATATGTAVFPPREGPLADPATWRDFSQEQVSKLSVLGRILFLNDTKNVTRKNKKFKILVWKFGKLLENRHVYHFEKQRHDPFEDCSVRNCEIKYEDKYLLDADAVIFHLHQTESPQSLPVRTNKNRNQRWIFLTDESPYNTFLHNRASNSLNKYAGIFNWSMSYRMDSDVPVPYGRAVPLSSDEAEKALVMVPKNYAIGKTGFATIMGSNCGGSNHRWDYVRELQKHMRIDVYGRCGNYTCPGSFRKDCPKIKNYKFYLAFENSNCREYITEKVWWNAYKNNVVPVIMGAPPEDLRHFLPQKSYLHVENFASPADLARFLIHLHNSDRDYNSYFQWKYKYKILNEHGYFQSPVYHYCRVCEALNYNNPDAKVYEHPEKFLDVKRDCHR